jgi:hypothetical protein
VPGFVDIPDIDDEEDTDEESGASPYVELPELSDEDIAPQQPSSTPTLDMAGSLLDGVSQHLVRPLAGAGMDLAAKAGILPEVEGGYDAMAQAELDRMATENPGTNLGGKMIGGAAMGYALAPGSVAAQAAGSGGVNAMGEAARGGDANDVLQAGVVGTAMGAGGAALSKGMGSPGAQRYALTRELTGGKPEAYHAIDVAAGGRGTAGTAGEGMGRVVDRARELGGGKVDITKLGQQANQAGAARVASDPRAAQLQQMQRFGGRAEDVARDPLGAGFAGGNNQAGVLANGRAALQQGDQQLLDQMAVDAILARHGAAKSAGMGQAVQGLRPTDMMSAKGLMKGLVTDPIKNAVSGSVLRPWTHTATGMAGHGAAALSADLAPPAIDNSGAGTYLNIDSLSPKSSTPAKEMTVNRDAFESVIKEALSTDKLGMAPQDEEALQRAVVDGNVDQINSLNYRLQLKYPGYQRAIEKRLRAMTGDEL